MFSASSIWALCVTIVAARATFSACPNTAKADYDSIVGAGAGSGPLACRTSSLMPASAIPIAKRDSNAVNKVLDYIKDPSNRASINPVCFFSGQTKVEKQVKKQKIVSTVKAETKLRELQQWKGCHAIAEIVAKAGVQDRALSRNDWKVVSRALAENVEGKQYALLGKEVRSNSVWMEDEKPALKANKKVTAVEVWEIEDDGTIKQTNKTKTTM